MNDSSTVADDEIVKISWSIKGYHVFRIKPHSDVDLLVLPEENNPYSPYAMKVKMPEFDSIPIDLRNATCNMLPDVNHHDQGAAKMRDIAGEFNICFEAVNMTCRIGYILKKNHKDLNSCLISKKK